MMYRKILPFLFTLQFTICSNDTGAFHIQVDIKYQII